jgi:hypothetical protein
MVSNLDTMERWSQLFWIPQLQLLVSPGQFGRIVPSGQPHFGQREQSKTMPWSMQRSQRNLIINGAPQ